MKRTLLTLLIFICLCVPARAQMLQGIVGGGASAAAPSCGAGTEFICENFEGSTACGDGATSTCNSTWTAVGGPEGTFQETAGKLEGTYSYKLDSANGGEGYQKAFTASDTVYFYLMINATTRPSFAQLLSITDGTNLLLAISNENPEFRLECGTATAYVSASNWTAGTVYHFWGDYTRDSDGGAASAVCNFYYSTNGTKPGTPSKTITVGTGTTQATTIRLVGSDETAVVIYDKIRVGTSAFGSNPQ